MKLASHGRCVSYFNILWAIFPMQCFIVGLINRARRGEIDPWCIRLPTIARPRFS